ncbi:MAG: hypothetical protein NVSMB17_12780 [Candidatus Dormibacteria bacterium]
MRNDLELDDVEVDGAPISGTSGRDGRIRFSVLRGLAMAELKLAGISLSDVVAERLDLTASDISHARVGAVRFSDCRCLGTNWAETVLSDVTFERCTLELSNLRLAKLARVVFEGCDCRSADLAGATLEDVVFRGCQLEGADFREARLARVDLRQSRIEGVKGVAGLRGATITTAQLLGLAPALAAELGIDVEA